MSGGTTTTVNSSSRGAATSTTAAAVSPLRRRRGMSHELTSTPSKKTTTTSTTTNCNSGGAGGENVMAAWLSSSNNSLPPDTAIATHSSSSSAAAAASVRPRLDSRDIPTTYSGLYGQGGVDLLPFELSRNSNTDWLAQGGWRLLCTYLGIILLFQCLFWVCLNDTPLSSWTVTHAGHFLVTLLCLHWIKGSPDDQGGELQAMTLWEQLVCTADTEHVQRALLVVPTCLCYAACQAANYNTTLCLINIILWAITILAKLPFMNGVRILGINRTAGIDDEIISNHDDDDDDDSNNDLDDTNDQNQQTKQDKSNKMD